MIVNADDLGFSHDRNRAILRAFDDGLISSATLMATRPCFEAACDVVCSNAHERRVGVHLVLTEDEPLTDAARLCAALCESGRFKPQLDRAALLRLGVRGRRVLREEMRAQVLRCREQGLPVTHLDSHHHSHADPLVIGAALSVAEEFGIPFVRLARNCDPRTRASAQLVRRYVNARIRNANRARTQWFGRVEDFEALRARGVDSAGDMEVMVHPTLSPQGALMDMGGVPLAEYVARLGSAEPVSYSGEPIRRRG
jgi:hypothetical protein